MPVMNDVRGDQHLNFTLDEAAAWLGEIRHHAPRVEDNDNAIAGVFGVVAVLVILTIIGIGFFGSTPRQTASGASETSVQPRYAVTTRTSTVPAPRPAAITHSQNIPPPEAIAEDVPPPPVTSENIPSPVAFMPAGWFYGRWQGESLPLRNKEGRSMGGIEDGNLFFATTAASPVQIIVSADGSYWGIGEMKPPENISTSPIPITPAFENAARVIREIEAFGVTQALYIYNRQEPEEAYLPVGWSMGDLAQDQPLTDGVNGARIGTIKRGTRLLLQTANVNDWRLVVSADGSAFGYACIRPLYVAPGRTPMRPECRRGVALIHRLEQGSGTEGRGEMRQALAENLPDSLAYGGEEH